MSIAFIEGDTLYGSTVLFLIGGTREEKILILAQKLLDMNYLGDYCDYEFYKKYDNGVDWESNEQVLEVLTRMLTDDFTIFNTDLTKAHEMYLYISEQKEDEWYKHFEYISGGREGIKIEYQNLDTGEKGSSEGVPTCR